MHYRIFIDQLKRNKKTTIYLCLLLVLTAFFVTSVNLYYNSNGNLNVAEESFSTLAVTELYGDVDRYGNLVEKNSEEHIGYQAVGVKGYDFREIVNSESVESYDLRTYYGAYMEEYPAMVYTPSIVYGATQEENPMWRMRSKNVIRFKITANVPLELKYTPPGRDQWKNMSYLSIEILDEASGIFDYPEKMTYDDLGYDQEEWNAHANKIKAFNQTDDTDRLILYPDVEYVAILEEHGSWIWNEEKTVWEYTDQNLASNFNLAVPWQDCESIKLTYDDTKEKMEYDRANSPFPIQRWEDVQNDPYLKAYFKDIWQDTYVQQRTHNVVATNDINLIPAFHMGSAGLVEGRFITEKEYTEGANVCLISKRVATNQGWKVGDKLNMKLFESDYIPEGQWIVGHAQPIYKGDETPFVSEGEYEIVGVYDVYDAVGNAELAVNTTGMLEYNIYIPTNSIATPRDLSDVLVHGATFSVKLKNGTVDAFQLEMKDKGITTYEEGKYVPTFHCFDQGYSAVCSSLWSMNSTAKLLLKLSSVMLLITCILVAYFFWQNNRQAAGVFRLLGGTKKQTLSAILACAMILTLISSVIGAALGSGASYFVGTGIVRSNIKEIKMDLSQDNDLSALTEQETSIRIQANPMITLVSSSATMMYPIALLGFAAIDIQKEPRELLPKGKG